ncbi:protein CASC3-like isoform X2, partial [Leptotrombidium deliense]
VGDEEPGTVDEKEIHDKIKKDENDDNEGYVEGERQQGDGQESGDQSGSPDDLDDDEDKRNPQYIPKRGAFYEHDDRMVAAVEEVEKVPEEPIIIAKNTESFEKAPNKKGKKLWAESDKWSHDLFNEDEQKPKSRDEVYSTYGYDIRNEDTAPKARRRRRYARGPTKYTRNWQDEDAYSKTKPERRNSQSGSEKETSREMSSRRPRRPAFKKDDFPELPSKDRQFSRGDRGDRGDRNAFRDNQASNAWNKSRNVEKESKRQTSPAMEFKTEPMKVIEAIENNRRSSIPVDPTKVDMVRTQTFENSRYTNKRSEDSSNSKDKTNYNSNLHINNSEMGRPIRKTSHLQDNRSLNYNVAKGDYPERKPRSKSKNSKEESFTDDNRNNYNQNYLSDVNNQMQKLTVDNKLNRSNESESAQQKPKRYSSLRQQQQQRSVPEGVTPTMSSNSQTVGAGHQQRPTPQNQFYDAAPHSPGFYQETASPRSSFAYIQQNTAETQSQSNQHPSRFMPHPMPQRYMPQSTPESSSDPPFITQAVPPPTTPQNSSSHPPVLTAPAASFLPTYPPGYPQFPPPPPQFHPLPPPPPSQAEIYRGGVTYYDTTAQQAALRQLPQRRPKNAIPIVPPPMEM